MATQVMLGLPQIMVLFAMMEVEFGTLFTSAASTATSLGSLIFWREEARKSALGHLYCQMEWMAFLLFHLINQIFLVTYILWAQNISCLANACGDFWHREI
jgi:hypothetical protein